MLFHLPFPYDLAVTLHPANHPKLPEGKSHTIFTGRLGDKVGHTLQLGPCIPHGDTHTGQQGHLKDRPRLHAVADDGAPDPYRVFRVEPTFEIVIFIE